MTSCHSRRILYLNHDNPNPSGGVWVIYSHVRHLVRNGFNAYVVHRQPGFRPPWFQEEVPVLYCDQQFTLFPNDIVVIPEDHQFFLELFKSAGVRKIVFCQSYLFVFDGLGRHESWQSLGISGVITSSEVVADFVRSVLGWAEVQVVHFALNPGLFVQRPKKLLVAYMPRKRPFEAQFIKNLCMHLLGPQFPVEWVALDGVPQTAVARTLSESSLFLSLSRLEGFGLPPLEAMASGCLVVGFTGFGGLEYANGENGFWCAEDDLVACARMLATAVRMVWEKSPEVERIVSGAQQTAAAYTVQRQEQELLQAIQHVMRTTQEGQ
jgi:glycosyltransferase involved in cell wall biosynthesis